MNEQTNTIVLGTNNLAGKYLTFMLESEEYGIEILKVREIIGLMGVTEIPRTPDYIRGVINLRGKIIPVLDLRAKFGMSRATDTDTTCIIVVDMTTGDDTTHMGVLVDTVCEVLDIKGDDIEAAPSFGTVGSCDFILGMAKCKDGVKILLKVARILESPEMASVVAAIQGTQDT